MSSNIEIMISCRTIILFRFIMKFNGLARITVGILAAAMLLHEEQCLAVKIKSNEEPGTEESAFPEICPIIRRSFVDIVWLHRAIERELECSPPLELPSSASLCAGDDFDNHIMLHDYMDIEDLQLILLL